MKLFERLKKEKAEGKTESPIEEILLAEFHKNDLFPETQYHIGNYRVDFAFPEEMIVVEADGWKYHKNRQDEDRERQEFLEENGWKVLRFWGKDILNQSDEIIKSILDKKEIPNRKQFKEGLLEPIVITDDMEEWEIEELKERRELQEEELTASVLASLKRGWKTTRTLLIKKL